jgi:hypothetical protein
MASNPTCGACPSGIRRRVESGEPRSTSLGGGVLSAYGHSDRNFECVPLWRFGNSRPRREITGSRNRIAASYIRREFTSWALCAANAAVNALPGRRRPRQ